MNTHAEILKELQKFRGGEFVPKDVVGVRLESRQIRGGFYWGRGEDYCQAIDAHAHIELAAWKAVREWCTKKNCRLMIDSRGGRTNLVRVNEDAMGWGLKTHPTDADALLATMKFINGGGA